MNLSEVFDFLETISEMQNDTSILALRSSGIYQVAKYFNRYCVSESVWKNLTPSDKKKKID